MILCGRTSGSAYTGRRLLVDCGVSGVVDLNRDRRLDQDSVKESELRTGEGYLWDAREAGDAPLTDREFGYVRHLIRKLGCRLVVVLDRAEQAPPGAGHHIVELTPPDPVEIALAVIRRHRPNGAEIPAQILKSELAGELGADTPPEKAVRAALLALRIADGDCETAEALRALRESVDKAVGHWFDKRPSMEYAMALAVAVLENHPVDQVMAQARALDELIRKAEIPEDKKPWPRRVFATSKGQLLDAVQAIEVRRPHPRHPDLVEETVRFRRQDWATALLRHAWREYHAIHDVFRDWLTDLEKHSYFGDAAERALCLIITGVPAHDPLRLLDELAAGQQVRQRELAASTLIRLAEVHGLTAVVRQALEDWVAYGSVYRKWTAALVYAQHFGRYDPHHTLDQLERIGRTDSERLRNVVVRGVLDMLRDPEHRSWILQRVLVWASVGNRNESLRTIGLALGMWLVGLMPWDALDVEEFTLRYREEIGTLLHEILVDEKFGPTALSRLTGLAVRAERELVAGTVGKAGRRLLHVTTLVTPDLRLRYRWQAVTTLTRAHPTRKKLITQIFRTARRVQRRTERSPFPDSNTAEHTDPGPEVLPPRRRSA